MAHLERPASATLQGAPDDNLKRAALKIVFAQHDADDSGRWWGEDLAAVDLFRVITTASISVVSAWKPLVSPVGASFCRPVPSNGASSGLRYSA